MQDDRSHGQEQETNEEEASPEHRSASPKDTPSHAGDEDSTETEQSKVSSPLAIVPFPF